MKKKLFSYLISTALFLMLFVSLKTYALDYTITFTGTGARTTVDSVIVQNLTKGTKLTIPGGNSLKLSDSPNAIEQLSANDEFIRIYPNLIEEKSTVSFYAKQAGSTQLNAFSIDGRKIAGITESLQAGVNSYQLSFPKGSFVIQVVGKGYAYTAKMINQTGTVTKPEIAYSGAVKQATSAPQKMKSDVTSMLYTEGDRLLFKGISGNCSTVVTDVPTTSKTTNFYFVPCQDADGNNYSVVTIGTQTWMVENLNSTKYQNGEPLLSDDWCNYLNDASYGMKYGKLYKWSAVTNTRNLAPLGWHIASDTEWSTLESYIISNGLNFKEGSGFNMLSGGYKLWNGSFLDIETRGYWWSPIVRETSFIWNSLYIYSYSNNPVRFSNPNDYYFSVRCIKNEPTNSLNIETVLIPAGTFTMGSPTTEVNRYTDETQHQVTLSAFQMSKYEITNAQYAAFLNAKGITSNGLYSSGAYPTQSLIYPISGSYDLGLHFSGFQWMSVSGYENYPVVGVTWYGATEYATYVGGTLPTEAQWEYACRAGTTTPFNTGNCLSNLEANYRWDYPYNTCTNTVTTYLHRTQMVGSYAPNGYGLYDMHGNVWEWCSDWYDSYLTTDQNNPTGAATGSNHVIRGGGWISLARTCRSAHRFNYSPIYNYDDLGFRVVFVP